MINMKINFGEQSNETVCTCGQHHGVGIWSPEERAAVYARIKHRMPSYMTPERTNYLATWEAAHGRVSYEMVQSHLASDADYKMFGIAKGTPIMKPVMSGHHRGESQQKRGSWHDIY